MSSTCSLCKNNIWFQNAKEPSSAEFTPIKTAKLKEKKKRHLTIAWENMHQIAFP